MHLWKDEDNFSAFDYYYPIESGDASIEYTNYEAVLTSRKKQIYQDLLDLSKDNKWKLIFRDKYSAVFIRL